MSRLSTIDRLGHYVQDVLLLISFLQHKLLDFKSLYLGLRGKNMKKSERFNFW